ncbi:hypothetical protein T265_02007 [Opisthorchis viverrini]|uniref:Uncharacterized protein n=1 Tax=Opisthorchis viverrini TaxID=6198 RepID=A0A075A7W5_OPIVI|nr:hypothetical protein T265_02007 [Opisthorchis viverrini]KER31770.1 hypothetical protein T265_02007 [Opisthorchis viverrini]
MDHTSIEVTEPTDPKVISFHYTTSECFNDGELETVAPFRCLAAVPPEGSTRAWILPGCQSLDRESREAWLLICSPSLAFDLQTFRHYTRRHQQGEPSSAQQPINSPELPIFQQITNYLMDSIWRMMHMFFNSEDDSIVYLKFYTGQTGGHIQDHGQSEIGSQIWRTLAWIPLRIVIFLREILCSFSFATYFSVKLMDVMNRSLQTNANSMFGRRRLLVDNKII